MPLPNPQTRLLLPVLTNLFLFTLVRCDLSSAPCYDVTGSVVQDDFACSPRQKHSACCGRYWTCLNNGLCSNQNTTNIINSPTVNLVRASCTDRTFNDESCPNFCLEEGCLRKSMIASRVLLRWICLTSTFAVNYRGVDVYPNNTFCCVSTDCQCLPDPSVKTLKRGVPVTTISFSESSGVALQTSSSTSSKAQKTSKATLSSSSSRFTATTGSTEPNSVASSSSQSLSPTALSGANSTSLPSPLPAPQISNTSLKIGLGVSIPIVCIAVLITVVLLLLRRRKKKSPKEDIPPSNSNEVSTPDYRGFGYAPQELDDPRRPGDTREELEPNALHEATGSPTSQELSPGVPPNAIYEITGSPAAQELPGVRRPQRGSELP